MKLKSLLILGLAAVVSLAGLAHGQTVPTPAVATQAITCSVVQPNAATATYALAIAPRYTYDPVTGAQANIIVRFFLNKAAYTAGARPLGGKIYTATPAQTTATFTPAAIQANGALSVGATWLLTQPDFTGATLATQ